MSEAGYSVCVRVCVCVCVCEFNVGLFSFIENVL